METAKPTGDIHLEVGGNVDGQIAVGTNIVQWNVSDGSTVVVTSAGEIARPRRRPHPVRLVGRRPRALLGRDAEVAVAEEQLTEGATVVVHGEGGVGKTSLLKTLAHGPAGAGLEGAVYLDVHDQPLEDLLQLLYDVFYECDVPYKPMPGKLRTYLHDLRALVVLDDVSLDRDTVQHLLDALPAATFVCASQERVHLDDSTVLALQGLPAGAARALLERQLGRPLAEAEAPAVDELCRATGGRPLSLIQAAALAQESGQSLAAVADRVRHGGSVSRDLLSSMDAGARTLASALAGIEGRSAPASLLGAAAGLADPAPALAALVERGLAQVDDERYSSALPGREATAGRTRWPARWSAALAEWAEAHTAQPEVVARETALIAHVVDAASRAGHWPEVLRLCRAANAGLVVSRRWGAWKQSLERGRQAALQLGEAAAAAWFLDQLRNRAASLGEGPLAPLPAVQAAPQPEADRGAGAAPPPIRPPAPRHPWGAAALALLALLVGAGMVWLLASPRDGTPSSASIRQALVAAPRSVDFDELPVGTAGLPATVAIRNVTTTRQQISAVGVGGTHADDFRVDVDRCSRSTVEADDECTVVISFRPSNTGPRSASLSVASATDAEAATVVLSGVGVGGDGDVSAQPYLVDFGTQALRTASGPHTVTVRPVAGREARLSAVTLSGRHAADFSLRNACPTGPLPAGGCTVEVVFTPSGLGTRGAELVVRSAGRAEPIAVAVTGRAVRPRLETTTTTTTTLSPAPSTTAGTTAPGQPLPPTAVDRKVDFGEVTINTTTDVRTATFRNDGPAPVAVQQVSVAGADAGDFAVAQSTCTTLAPGAACQVGVRFSARGVGTRTATLVIAHSAPGGAAQADLAATSVPKTVGMTVAAGNEGYALVERSGHIQSVGSDPCPAQGLNPGAVGVATVAKPSLTCWVAAADGTVVGSNGTTAPPPDRKAPVVGIAAEQDGYWLVTSAGEVFATKAGFFGDKRSTQLKSPIVGLEPTPSFQGYWLVAADGAIFTFGDAVSYGDVANFQLQAPVVGMERSLAGYWIVTANGQVYPFGSAELKGDVRYVQLAGPVTSIAGTGASNSGYCLTTADGAVYAFGTLSFLGG